MYNHNTINLTYNASSQSAQKDCTNLLTIGKKYRVSFDFGIDGITTASFTLSNGSTQVRDKLTTITTKEITEFTATATNLTLLATLSAGNYGRLAHIDNLVIEEIFEVGEGYRFGFNGMEKDNDTYGEGNAYDFGARIYDSRLGRWLSVDPYSSSYYSISTYAFCANTSMLFVDYDGARFDNPYTGKKVKAAQALNDANDIYNSYLKEHPDLPKNPTFFRRLFNIDYREKHKLENNIIEAQNTLSEMEQKEVLVNNLLKTFEMVNREEFNRFNTMENPDKSEVTIPIFMSDEYKWDGTLADTRIRVGFNENTGQTSFGVAKVRLYFKQGYESLMNELGDIDYAKNMINDKEKYNAYYDKSIPYEERPETIYSFGYERKESIKFNKFKSENNIKSKDLDERGSLNNEK